jgi:N-acetylglutamate synthase-like GNAT family acetyltransferase
MKNIIIKKATKKQILPISNLTKKHSSAMLYRTPEAIRKLLGNYFVALNGEEVIGCCGFKTYPRGDAEIISLAVERKYRYLGLGGKLITKVTKEAFKRSAVKRVMAFTNPRVTPLFRKNGFIQVGVQLFHEKILEECRKCPRNRLDKNNKYHCNEIAMVYCRK